jgi:rubrerythrin
VLFDIEAPEYDAVRAFMSVQSALEVALTSEIKAYDFYDGALGEVTDPEVKELFVQLRDEESHHQAMIRDVMAKVPDDDTFDPDDFVDDPVGH